MATISTVTLFSLLLLTATAPPPPTTATQPVSNYNSTLALDLIHRLKLDHDDDSSPNCWDSLVELQACSGELILFFINGETYIGDGCCDAIRAIGKQCWPDMLGTLGFTSGEGDVLQGYCDGEAAHKTTSSSGSDGHVQVVQAKISPAP